jgi:hypothetical protein
MKFTPATKVSLTVKRASEFQCPPGKGQAFLWSSDVDGFGVRATPNGEPSYVWQGRWQGKVVRVTIGPVSKIDLKAGASKSKELMGLAASGTDPREQKRLVKVKAAEQEAEKAAARVAKHFTLGKFADRYVEHLEKAGRISAKDVKALFRLHLHPHALSTKAARDVNTVDVLAILKTAARPGHRTSDKLRTSLLAAFNLATKRQAVSTGGIDFADFGIKINPVANINPIQASATTDKNPLSVDELRTYWKALQDVPGMYGQFLRLHLLSGGQRIVQLSRLTVQDIKDDHFELVDLKGRGNAVRKYAVPITPSIRTEIDALAAGKTGYLLDNGRGQPIEKSAISDWPERVRHGIAGFQLKRVRSGVETALSASGISKDIRGELQSHGIGGVQKRHYDAHDFLQEKSHALNVLFELLNGEIK